MLYITVLLPSEQTSFLFYAYNIRIAASDVSSDMKINGDQHESQRETSFRKEYR